ncbi:hypothetical protein CSC94_12735 [Zhengella mangrovi]|uniref:DUF3277 domain-containing protein n=1 Tax=Zhengella mangrovi TaxID=1982044 RepID=A0A2G1QM51_9HYPH|nr:phage protein [Zhengella mangrovi]PHP66549.1 hypothetical protein CSC94_12735 [Zhengella mangrovi]
MADITTYSAKSVQVSLDGRDVRGLWDGDDVVMVERSSDRGTPVVGADGSTIFSTSADESAVITLKLQHTSPAHAYLRSLERAMTAGRTRKFPVSIRDTESGEGGSAAECVIQSVPSVNSGSANASEREWKLFAGRWAWSEVEYEA